MISLGCRLLSISGVFPGTRWKSANAMVRSPGGPVTWTFASIAARATHMSEGCVAMQVSLVAGIALVAGRRRIIEVVATRSLQQIAAGRCHIAQLRRSAR